MFQLDLDYFFFIGLCLEGFFYGLYSGLFAMYLQYQVSKKYTTKTQNTIFYSICILYVLSVAVFVCDMTTVMYNLLSKPLDSIRRIDFIQLTSFACCDFIAQFILIYRCWIVWGRNIWVVIIPSILALSFLAIWLACVGSVYILSDELGFPPWAGPMLPTGLALSLTVNTLVMALIVFRIFRVFRDTLDDKSSGTTGRSKLRRIIFILIESGMALFSIQLARLTATIALTEAAKSTKSLSILITTHEMLTGITPTIILVRTSMGLSFDDEKSMEEVAIESFRFASNHSSSVSEMGSISIDIDGQDSDRRDDDFDIQRGNDIDVVER